MDEPLTVYIVIAMDQGRSILIGAYATRERAARECSRIWADGYYAHVEPVEVER